MGLESLLYISESKIAANDAERDINDLIERAQAFNASVGITGSLLFTGTHFAQVIEGDEAAVSGLMAAISRDRRHARVKIVTRGALMARRFPGWSMAYNGPSQFVSHHVSRLLNEPSPSESARAAHWLSELLEQFAGYRGCAA